jgi:hypothetical protein
MVDSKPAWWFRTIRLSGWIALWIFIFWAALWCTLALYYSNLPAFLRPWVAGLFAVASIAALFFLKPRRRGIGAFLALFTVVLVYWLMIPASNDRQWRKDVSVLPWAEVEGNKATIHNIRNSEYRTRTDFDLHHYDRTYDLNQLRSIDFYMSFWAPIPFCHTMLTFGFENGDFLCISIETRPEEHEVFDPIAACFKQFELVYIAGDERDLVRLRTNFRDEAVYLYRIDTTREAMRRIFLRYCRRMNELKARPEWYCTFTRNCTTDIPRKDGRERGVIPESWKVLINGFVDELLYRQGSLDQSMPLAELRKLGHINTRAQNADSDPEFSRLIRVGIPEIQPAATGRKD